MARNPFLVAKGQAKAKAKGRPSGGGGGSGNPFLPGGGKPTAKQGKKIVEQALTKKGGGGFGGFVSEISDTVTGFPKAGAKMAVDFGKEVSSTPVALGKKILAGPGSEESNDVSMDQVDRISGLGGAKAFGRGLIEGGEVPDDANPITSGFGQSFHRTAVRAPQAPLALVGKGEYAEAWREGRLFGALIEDAANLSVVASAGAKALDVSAQGALSRSAAARVEAENIAARGIPQAEKVLADAQARLTSLEQTAAADAARGIHDATHFTKISDATATRDAAAAGLERLKLRGAEQARLADDLLAGQTKMKIRAHRVAHAVESFGAKGANAPAYPYTFLAKGLGKAGKFFLKAVPGIDEMLGRVSNYESLRWLGKERRGNRADAHTVMDEVVQAGERRAAAASEMVNEMAQAVGGDAELFTATLIDLQGGTPLLADALERTRLTPGGDAFVDQALNEIAQRADLNVSRQTLDYALAIRNGTLTPEMMAAVRKAQETYRRWLADDEARYLTAEGGSRALTPEAQAQREWNVSGNDANPIERRALEARQLARREQIGAEYVDAAKAAVEAKGRIKVDPEVMANLPDAIAANVERAVAMAERLVEDALASPAGLQRLITSDIIAGLAKRLRIDPTEFLAALGDPATKEAARAQLLDYLAEQIEKAAGSAAKQRRSPVLAQAVREGGLEPLRVLSKGKTAKLERMAKRVAKAEAEARHAERTRAVAERLGEKQAAHAEAIVKASDKLLRAQAKLKKLQQEADAARERIADSATAGVAEAPPLVKDAEAVVRDARRAVAEAAAEERRALAAGAQDFLPDQIAFVPGGVMDHWDTVNQAVGVPEWNIVEAARKIKGDQWHAGRNPRWRSRPMADAWYTAYREMWESLPTPVKRGMRKLSRAEITALYDEWSGQGGRAGLDPTSMGLDVAVDEWATAAGRSHLDINEQAAAFADAFRRERALRRIEESGPTSGFIPSDLDEFFDTTTDPAMADLASDPALRGALERGRLRERAAAIQEGRLAERAATTQRVIPDAESLTRRLEGEPFPYEAPQVEQILTDILGQEGAHDFLSRWMEAGEPNLTNVLSDLERGVTPEWLARTPEERAAAKQAVANAEAKAREAVVIDQDIEQNRAYGTPADELTPAEVDRAVEIHRAALDHIAPDGVPDPFAYMDTLSPEDRALYDRYREMMDRSRSAVGSLPADERALARAEIASKTVKNPEPRLTRLAGEGGATTVGRMADQAERAAERTAASVATDDIAAARMEAATSALTPSAVRQIADHGGQVKAYRDALRAMKVSERRLARMPEVQQRELIRFEQQIKNYSSRNRAPAQILGSASDVVAEIARTLDDADPVLLDAVNDLHLELARAAAEFTGDTPKLMGPNGELIPVDRRVEPVYVPGRREGPGSTPVGSTGAPGRLTKLTDERFRKSAAVATSPEEFLRDRLAEVRRETMNEVARNLESTLGVYPEMILGPERAAELGARMRDAEAAMNERIEAARVEAGVDSMPVGEARTKAQVRLDERIDRIKREMGKEALAAKHEIYDAMDEAGFEAWNPRALTPTTKKASDLRTTLVGSADEITTSTTWLPKGVAGVFDDQYRGTGWAEEVARMMIDKPTNAWKTMVLPLSPRWQVGNGFGNYIMGTLGAGIDPFTLARAMKDASALMRREDLAYRAALGLPSESRLGRVADRLGGGAAKRLAKVERRIAGMDQNAVAAITDADGRLRLDSRLHQGTAGAAGIDPYRKENVTVRRSAVRQAAHDIIQRSYNANAFVDNMNRIAVFLEKYKKMSDAELSEFAARNRLSSLRTPEQIRMEGAVRMSLDAVGDFQHLSRFERQVIRRVVPFYAWMKHITQLAYRLPLRSPVRTVWFLHLADMWGGGGEDLPWWLAGAIPGQDDDTYWRLPRINPLQDVITLPQSGRPGDIVKAGVASMGPVPRLALAAGLGLDSRTLMPIKTPPGKSPLDGSGNPTIDPLLFSDPRRLAGFLLDFTPQTKFARSVYEQGKYGHPIARYPTGEPYKDSSGEPYKGASLFNQALGWAGLPYKQKVDVQQVNDYAEAKRARARAASDRYDRAGSKKASAGSNPFLP